MKSLHDILPDLLRLAEIEKSCQLMAAEIKKTRRRVNALEHVLIPEMKDMMLEQAYKYNERYQNHFEE